MSARPQLSSRKCPTCGSRVDPLRAGDVVLLPDGFRYLCGEDCAARFREGERPYDHVEERPSPTLLKIRSEPTSRTLNPVEPIRHAPVGEGPNLPSPPWNAVALTGGAAVFGLLSAVSPIFAVVSLAALAGAFWLELRGTQATRDNGGLLGWLAAPLGLGVAALGAVAALFADPSAWTPLFACGVAGGIVLGRRWLDRVSTSPVLDQVDALVQRLPPRARVASAEESLAEVAYREVDSGALRTGEEVMVVAGETLAVDGVVRTGEATAFLHPSSTEPVPRRPGDTLLAGARIAQGAVHVLATRVGVDRALARPSRFYTAGTHASPTFTLALRASQATALVAFVAALAAVALAGDLASQLSAVAAILLATPFLAMHRGAQLPLVAAASTAVERGLVFQNNAALDRAGRVSVTALMTRGTVTEGSLRLMEVKAQTELEPNRLLSLAAGAEASCEDHPIARALLSHADAQGISRAPVRRVIAVPGRGLTAVSPEGEPLVVGSRQLLLDEGVSVAVADAEAATAEARGHSVVFLGLGGHCLGFFALQDSARPGARAAVQRLFDLDIEVVLLSGDHRPTTEVLARSLDITDLRAELAPAERGAAVERLRESGGVVAVAGRGPHDEPALEAADVPILLGAAGGSHADRMLTLTTDDVRDAAVALWIARAARTAALRSVALATGLGLSFLLLAATGVLPPLAAALAGLSVDAFALPAGARLLRRFELRIPALS